MRTTNRMYDLETLSRLLAYSYGLQLIVDQNDIDEALVIGILIDKGLVDIEEYLSKTDIQSHKSYEEEEDYDDGMEI